jgi:hypothetical protein
MRQTYKQPLSVILGLVYVCSLLTACGVSQTYVEPATAVTAATEVAPTATQMATASPTAVPVATVDLNDPSAVAGGQPPGLVYKLEDAVWLVDADGRSIQVSEDSRVYISPDGSQLVRYNPDDTEYWLADRVTGAARSLTRTPRRRECCFRWWPAKPGTVLFHSIDPTAGPSGVSPGPMGFLTAVNVDGTGYRILDREHDVGLPAIAPSPDGQAIAYGWGDTVWLYRWDTGVEVFDPFEYGLTEGSNLALGSPAWSPDGTKLAWVISGELGEGIRGGMALVVFDLAERTARLFHPFYQTQKGLWPEAPAWSPDGRWLAFEAWAQDPDEDGVWVIQVDGEQEHYLGQGSHPVWSPDGLKLAFSQTAQYVTIGILAADVDVWEPYPLDSLTGAWLKDWVDVESGEPDVETAGTLHTEMDDAPLPDPCLGDSEDSALFVNPVDGYCLRYPARFRVDDVYPPGIANLYGPPHDQTLEPVMAASTILVADAAQDRNLADSVDGWLAQHSVHPVTQRQAGLLGGEPAEIVEGQGERSGLRAILAVHDGKLYALTFYPVDDRFPQAAPDVQALWDTVTRSFAFLSPGALDKRDTDPRPTPPAPADTPEPPRLSFEPTTYRDELAGFEFDHPRSWTLAYQERQGRGYVVGLCAQPPDRSCVQVTMMQWEPDNLDSYASKQEGSWLSAGNAIVSREEWTLAEGHRAIRYLIQNRSGERNLILLTTIGEQYLLLSGSSDLDLLAEIAQTVRLLEP